MQSLINKLATLGENLGLTIILTKTNVSVEDVSKAPELQTRRPHFRCSRRIHLGFTISKKLSLDPEISRRIGKATGTMSNLTKKARDNKYLTWNTKMHNYHACVLSSLTSCVVAPVLQD